MDFNDDEDYDSNYNGMLDEVSSRHEVLAGDRYDSDGEEAIPDGVPRARTLSHMINWNSSSEEEEEEEDEEEQVAAMKNNDDKYEYYDENEYPASPDDAAHVFLADLCRRIGAPLYAYDEILQWAQEAYLSGYRH
jgi:hypothetical protein